MGLFRLSSTMSFTASRSTCDYQASGLMFATTPATGTTCRGSCWTSWLGPQDVRFRERSMSNLCQTNRAAPSVSRQQELA